MCAVVFSRAADTDMAHRIATCSDSKSIRNTGQFGAMRKKINKTHCIPHTWNQTKRMPLYTSARISSFSCQEMKATYSTSS